MPLGSATEFVPTLPTVLILALVDGLAADRPVDKMNAIEAVGRLRFEMGNLFSILDALLVYFPAQDFIKLIVLRGRAR